MTEAQHDCNLHLPIWKCLEMGCKTQYDRLQRLIDEKSAAPESQETLEALYLLSIYFPDNPIFNCVEVQTATHSPDLT
jgi:hypothetical protein